MSPELPVLVCGGSDITITLLANVVVRIRKGF